MLTLKHFQEEAVHRLLMMHRKLLHNERSKVCVFKSPTGSGKTMMMAEFLKRLASGFHRTQNNVFIWLAPRKLHLQSKQKLTSYLRDTPYHLITVDEMSAGALPENTVVFANWEQLTNTYRANANLPDGAEPGDWSNVAVRDREDGRSIKEVVQLTREEGKQIILMIDEAHLNSANEQNNAVRFIDEVIKPRLTYEVSATPQTPIDIDDVNDGKQGYVSVRFDDVVADGLIKQETIINAAIDHYVDFCGSADDVVLTAALAKRKTLADFYCKNNINVNPLLLIQLPNDSKAMTKDDNRVKDEVEAFLAEKNITYKNGKLAVWLSEEKSENLDTVTQNDSPVEVLLFKTAIATGWDCPRAQVLVMLRPIGSITFEIQTVGRILRTPEGKHYEESGGLVADLNKAFIFTNIPSIDIKKDDESITFFKNKFTRLKEEVRKNNVALPSIALSRTERNDLMENFETFLVDELNERCGITGEVMQQAKKKAAKKIELSTDKLKVPLLSDLVLQNIDQAAEEIDTENLRTVHLDPSVHAVQDMLDKLTLLWSLPYAPSRSYGKIKIALAKWCGQFGYSSGYELNRLFVCSAKNQDFVNEALTAAKEKYAMSRSAADFKQRETKEFTFSLPERLEYGEGYEPVQAKKYAYGRCYLRAERPNTEKDFEKKLDADKNIAWWFKNGDSGAAFFAVAYQQVHSETNEVVERSFYPDYIVRYADGKIGIYDTKSGFTARAGETAPKSDALQRYLSANRLTGGIVKKREDGFYLFARESYTEELAQWKKI